MAKAKYEVVGSFYDNWQMHEEGAVVEYGGEPGENLKPLNAEAKAAKAKVLRPQIKELVSPEV